MQIWGDSARVPAVSPRMYTLISHGSLGPRRSPLQTQVLKKAGHTLNFLPLLPGAFLCSPLGPWRDVFLQGRTGSNRAFLNHRACQGQGDSEGGVTKGAVPMGRGHRGAWPPHRQQLELGAAGEAGPGAPRGSQLCTAGPSRSRGGTATASCLDSTGGTAALALTVQVGARSPGWGVTQGHTVGWYRGQ